MTLFEVIGVLAVLGAAGYAFKRYASSQRSTPASNESTDAGEGSFWEVGEPLPARARVRIRYIDARGLRTERSLEVRQFGSYGPTHLIIGHCGMRNATRTFRADRIKRCIDEETGELIHDLPNHLTALYEASPDASKDRLLESEFDALRVLLYVAKADGQLRAAEKEVIRRTCRALANDSKLTDSTIDQLFRDMDVPTLQAFRTAVGRLATRDVKSKAAVLGAAAAIVATQKTVHGAEQDALKYLKERFV